jgi:hypothetical protein
MGCGRWFAFGSTGGRFEPPRRGGAEQQKQKQKGRGRGRKQKREWASGRSRGNVGFAIRARAWQNRGMGEDRRPLIPRFSVRSMLLATAVAAVAAFVVSLAGRGVLWAEAVSIGLALVVLAFAIYVILFAIAWLIAGACQRSRVRTPPGQGSAVTDKVAAKTIFVLAWLILATSGRNALAVSGGMMTLPGAGENRTGLQLTVDTRWIDASGYRPVRIELRRAQGAATSQRVLTIRLRPHAHTSSDTIVVSQDIRIPDGSEDVSTVISVPQLGPWVSFEMDVYENGRYIEALSIGPSRVATTWSGTFESDSRNPAVLVIGDPVNLPLNGLAYSEVMHTIDQTAAWRTVPTIFPTRWIDYSGFDLVVAPQRDLATFVAASPAQWHALRDWLLAGGTMIVSGAGDNSQNIGDIQRTLGVAMTQQAVVDSKQSEMGDFPLKLVDCGLGTLVVLRSDAELFDKKFPWTRLREVLGAGRWRWSDRWGLSLFSPNCRFNDFLIPRVGRAPVNAFCVLMTLFVVAAVPANWLVLRKLGKLNLFVFTVPAIAALTTVGFVAYALSAGGLGLRLRARSVEVIDQASGDSACLGRLSYYAGLAAPLSLQFSGQTVVLPLEEVPEYFSSTDRSVRRLDWVAGQSAGGNFRLEQRLTDGWLKTRTPTQFVTARVLKTQARLDFSTIADERLQVTNQLGTRISHLVVADEASSVFAGEAIAAGTTAALAKVNSPQDERVARFIAAIEGSRPEMPKEISTVGESPGVFGLSAARQYAFGPGWRYRTIQTQKQDTSLLERAIAEPLEQVKDNRLPPRTYLAIVDFSPAMEPGAADAREEASFHLVIGHW